MIRRHLVALLLVASLAAGCQSLNQLPVEIPLITGPKLSDEVVIAAVLDDVQRGMQERKVFKVLAHVSRNYRDAEGRDYSGIQRYLNEIFSLYREIRITRVSPVVEVRGYQATATETFGTIAEPFDPSKAPPVQIQGQMRVFLEKVDNRWLIVEWGNVQ
jgi:hypothetical protein